MNTTSITMNRASSRSGIAWKVTLILIPLVTLGLLLWLRNVEVVALRQRTVSSYGTVPPFQLVNQNGQAFGSAQLAGKIWIADFIYTSCTDTCPLQTGMMAKLQEEYAAKPEVQLVSITVDPERDTPQVLKGYAQAHHANPAGWSFLTGTPAEIRDVAGRYGVIYKKTPRGDVDHTFLTSLVDQNGTLRVQYMGVKFDPDEMLRDLKSLVQEAKAR